MKLYYYDQSANFGDCLNAWLWERLLPGRWNPGDGISFSGIGTIINNHMPPSRRWIVFGSGVGYGGLPTNFGGPNWTITSVRGPLSAAVLGLPASAAITDTAMLLATLPEYAASTKGSASGVLFVPHHEAEIGASWPEACRRAGIEYLSPLRDSREVVEHIRSARLVLAEAMHAAIVADALRVPWLPVVSSPQVSTFKWLDWTKAMELPYAPTTLPPTTTQLQLRNSMLWAYGQSHRFDGRRLDQAVAHFGRLYTYPPSSTRARMSEFGRRVHRRVDRTLRSPRLAAWRSARDEQLVDRAAAALSVVARSPGILSEDRIFSSRLDALNARLAELR